MKVLKKKKKKKKTERKKFHIKFQKKNLELSRGSKTRKKKNYLDITYFSHEFHLRLKFIHTYT